MGADISAQTLGFAIFFGIGLASGLLGWLVWSLETCFGTRMLANWILEVLLVSITGAFCLWVEWRMFDFQIAFWHICVTFCVASITAAILWRISRKKAPERRRRCQKFLAAYRNSRWHKFWFR